MSTELTKHDLHWCRTRLPRHLVDVMKKHGPACFVAGGYVRACVAGEPVSDVDVFAMSKAAAEEMAAGLARRVRPDDAEPKVHTTDNAYTVLGLRLPVQFIHRWTFDTPAACLASFDFTIARAALWWEHETPTSAARWCSACDERFYPDLAAKRLVYCSPDRDEEPGGSLLRVLKFYQRGYRIPLDSFGRVIGRTLGGVPEVNYKKRAAFERENRDALRAWEDQIGMVLTGLLREVDPAIDPDHIAHLPSDAEIGQNDADAAGPQPAAAQ